MCISSVLCSELFACFVGLLIVSCVLNVACVSGFWNRFSLTFIYSFIF